MKYDIKEIERIVQNIDIQSDEDLEIDKRKCLSKWEDEFFFKIKGNEKILPDQFHNFCKKLKEFKKTNCSEEIFQQYYPNYHYEKYISPWDYGIMKVSKRKYQKIAFELSNHISLEFQKLSDLVEDLYRVRQKPTFEDLSTLMACYDKKLYAELIAYSVWVDYKKDIAS